MNIDKCQIFWGGITMDYNALIQNRKSARQFTDKKVGEAVCAELEGYYQNYQTPKKPQQIQETFYFEYQQI